MLFCIGTGEPGAPAPAEGGGSVLRLLSNQNFNPTRLIVVSFGAIILLGTFLLHLPISARDGQFTPWLTCLFTATSATCVTGLVLVDSALHWTPFGQGVILAMIQLGGLGFVSLISLIPLLLRRRIGLSQRLAIASAFNLNGMCATPSWAPFCWRAVVRSCWLLASSLSSAGGGGCGTPSFTACPLSAMPDST